MSYHEDRHAYVRVFGETVKLRGGTISILGIFDGPYSESLDISGENPQLTVVSSDLPTDLAEKESIVFRGGPYEIAQIQPDGTGMTVLLIREAD